MKMQQAFLKSALFGAMLASGAASATTLLLPGPNEMSTGLYHDFEIYSLDLLEQCAAAGDLRCLPSGPFPVQSSPGQISDQAVVLTGSDGTQMNNVTSPFATGSAVDNPFLTPSGNQSNTFEMTSANEPASGAHGGDGFPGGGDQAGTWEVSISLLRDWLGTSNLVFLFDNNQDGTSAGQTLLVWAQAKIIDGSGNQAGGQCYEISGHLGTTGCGSVPALNNNNGDYLPVVGDFCVDKVTGVSYDYGLVGNTGDCAGTSVAHPAGGYYVSNNISTSVAEFAAYNKSLETAVKSGAYDNYFLSINTKYLANDAGYEQLWICSDCDIDHKVPEPAALGLLGIGLLGMFAVSRRRLSK